MKINLSRVTTANIIIILAGLLLFLSFNGRLHLFDWDEINFAESAREMLVTNDYSTVRINYEPFWEKPPLFIWMQAFSMQIFGINEFAARFPNGIAGVITLLFLFSAGRRLSGFRMGWLWALVYAGSFLPFFYFKSGIIDPWFNLFIYGSLYTLILYTDPECHTSKNKLVLTGGLLLGLAILTKGPVAILVTGLSFAVFLVLKKFRVSVHPRHVLLYALATILAGGSWFLYQLLTGNHQIIIDFIEYQIRLFNTRDAGHGGFLLYHFVVVFFGVFPAALFMIPAFRNIYPSLSKENHYRLWNLAIMMTVLVLFTIVRTKIVHYSSLAYFPLTFLAAQYLDGKITLRSKSPRWITAIAGFLVMVYALAVILLSQTDRFKKYFLETNLIRDEFAKANLMADGGWKGIEWAPALLLIGGLVLFMWFNNRNNLRLAVISLFSGSLFFMYFSMVLIVPRVEAYSQRALIEFCSDVSDENSYVSTLGFKSYAVYFYARRMPPGIPPVLDLNSELEIPGSATLYVVMKNIRKDQFLEQYPGLEFLYEKNGYVFTRYTGTDHIGKN